MVPAFAEVLGRKWGGGPKKREWIKYMGGEISQRLLQYNKALQEKKGLRVQTPSRGTLYNIKKVGLQCSEQKVAC